VSYPPSYFLALFPREKEERLENWPGQDVENVSHFVFSRVIPFLLLPPLFPREKEERLENWPRQDVEIMSHFVFSCVIPSPLPQREAGKTIELAPIEC
jgi:hypothetical protein